MKELVWNVYNHDYNSNKIKVENVFNLSYTFKDCIYKMKKEYMKNHQGDFNWFSEELKRWSIYCYWTKCEYEIGLTSWPSYISKKDIEELTDDELNSKSDRVGLFPEVYRKIDVFQQLELNWEAFARYVFENIKKVKKVK